MSILFSPRRSALRSYRRIALFPFALLLLWLPSGAPTASVQASEPAREEHRASVHPDARPTDLLLNTEDDPWLADLLDEILGLNPELAALKAGAQALDMRPEQAGSLPDPQASITGYLRTPETRVGPVKGKASLSQRFPWFGRRELRAEAEAHAASAAWKRYEARRLELFTDARVLVFEIAFLDQFSVLTHIDGATLSHFEELARARYSSGVGLQQDAIRIQAEITRVETKLLDIAERRASLVASLNALRNRTEHAEIPSLDLPGRPRVDLDIRTLQMTATRRRPEVAAATAEMARTAVRVDLARTENRPDVTFALTYSVVDRRSDPAALLMPPEDDGMDAFGLTVGFNLPIRRKRISAGVNEALEHQTSAEELRRDAVNRIQRDVEDLTTRIPLIHNQLDLLDKVLVRQSEESLRSVEAAYGAGSVNALDLLDAERMLIGARTAVARTRADYAIAVARLEGAIAGPLPATSQLEGSQP